MRVILSLICCCISLARTSRCVIVSTAAVTSVSSVDSISFTATAAPNYCNINSIRTWFSGKTFLHCHKRMILVYPVHCCGTASMISEALLTRCVSVLRSCCKRCELSHCSALWFSCEVNVVVTSSIAVDTTVTSVFSVSTETMTYTCTCYI